MPRVLVVEDDAVIARVIALQLQKAGVESDAAPTLAEARRLLETGRYDLVTLDVNFPDGNGLEFCSELKHKRRLETPIIILTAEVSAESVVKGLEQGAADYLRKPIDPEELRARLRGHLKDVSATTAATVLEFGPLTLDVEKRTLHNKGRKVALKGRQFDILAVFLRRPEVVVTREQLIELLSSDLDIYDRTVDSHVSQLRKKLKDQDVTGVEIASIYGVGYRLETK